MKLRQSKQDEVFQNLLTQIKTYIQQNDQESLKYLLQDQKQQFIKEIYQKLTEQEKPSFEQILSKIKNQKPLENNNNLASTSNKIQPFLEEQKSEDSDEEFVNKFQKEIKVSGIVYGQNYSYPFLGLIQKISTIYFSKSHPNPAPQQSLKMLHSLIQTLFTYFFNEDLKENIKCKKGKRITNISNYLKKYLCYVFSFDYQNFMSFQNVVKKVKHTLKKDQSSNTDQSTPKDSLPENSPLISTKDPQELQYYMKVTEQIKNPIEFKQFNKIKSLNFLYFGEEKFKNLIDPEKQILNNKISKDVLQLISFIICRFIRKIILKCIKDKKNGKLQFLKNTQNLETINIKMVGNQIIDAYKKKIQQFTKSDQPIEQKAKRTFLQEFYEYEYEKFIPKNIIQDSEKNIKEKKSNIQSLPEHIWNNHKQYQHIWTERMAGQQFSQYEGSNKTPIKHKGKNNDYFRFIQNNFAQFLKNPSNLWIKYFTMSHSAQSLGNQYKNQLSKKEQQEKQKNIQIKGLKGIKKMKLQSFLT